MVLVYIHFIHLLASCSGERKFKELDDSDGESIFLNDKESKNDYNSIKLWWLTDINNYK